MRETSKYIFFWGGVFSQWYRSPFISSTGVRFNSCEQYMMYAKAMLFGDREIAEMILKTNDPKKVKELGRKVKNFNQELWDIKKQEIVFIGNMYKFSQNIDLKTQLLSTKDKEIVEASPYDTIWGIGLSENDERVLDKSKWKGQNLLGIALMRVREELRNARK